MARRDAYASREAWVNAAKKYVGLEPTDPEYVSRVYLNHLPGGGNDLQRQQAKAMAKSQSGCGLVWEAIARDVGVTWPHTREWYGRPTRIGGVIRDAVKAAKADKAWVDATKVDDSSPMPKPGDMVLIGGGAGWAKGGLVVEHVMTVTGVDGAQLHSVDGGQPGVAERTRVLVRTPQGELWVASRESAVDADGRPTVGRRVRGWIDASKVPVAAEKGGPAEAQGPFPGGGSSSGGGSSASWECPPCEPGDGNVSIGDAFGFLLLAFLAGELTGQWIEEERGSRRRRLR